MTSSSRRPIFFSILFLLAIVAVTCTKQPQSPSLRDVRVRLDWTPWAPHAALYAATDQGYFAASGLKVTLYVPPDPEATTKLVASGQDTFGISYMTDTLLAREQGFKVRSVAALIDHPLNCIMTLKKSGITTPAGLRGKTIGTTGVPSDEAFLEDVLQKNNVASGTYKTVNLGFNLAQGLKSGNVDAVLGAYWPWEGIKMEQDGYPVNVIRLQDFGVPDYYELILIAREDLIAKDPALVRSFLAALVKGQRFVQDHTDKAIDILRKASPDLSQDFLTASLNVMLPLMHFPQGQFRQDPQKWQEMVAFMRQRGLMKKDSDPAAAFTNEFLPE